MVSKCLQPGCARPPWKEKAYYCIDHLRSTVSANRRHLFKLLLLRRRALPTEQWDNIPSTWILTDGVDEFNLEAWLSTGV